MSLTHPMGYSVGKVKFAIKENDKCYRAQKEGGWIQSEEG